MEKIFVLFIKDALGDNICTSSLCQNIKLVYPQSKIIFVTYKGFEDTVRYLEGVDEVIGFDRKGIHKGVWGLMRFLLKFPRRVFTSILVSTHISYLLTAKLIGSKNLIMHTDKNPQLIKMFSGVLGLKIAPPSGAYIVDRYASALEAITGIPSKKLSVKYNPPQELRGFAREFYKKYKGKKLIGLCPLTAKEYKDFSFELSRDIIKSIPDREFVLFGKGQKAAKLADDLKQVGVDFIDITNKTSILEMAQILKLCEGVISADTGILHFGVAVGLPTVGVYLIPTAERWSHERENRNPHFIEVVENFTFQNIVEKYKLLVERNVGLKKQ